MTRIYAVMSDTSTDVEFLDVPPQWDALPGQFCRVGYVNGGDSATHIDPERGWNERGSDYGKD